MTPGSLGPSGRTAKWAVSQNGASPVANQAWARGFSWRWCGARVRSNALECPRMRRPGSPSGEPLPGRRQEVSMNRSTRLVESEPIARPTLSGWIANARGLSLCG